MLRRVILIVVALVVIVFVVPWALSRIFARDATIIEFDAADVRSTERDESQLRVGAFNIAHGRGLAASNWTDESYNRRWARLRDIGELLSRSDLDVVVLNEVDFDAHWSYGSDQAAQIALAGGYRYIAEVPNLGFRIGPVLLEFGNAVLSRYPLRDVEVIDLPAFSAVEAFFAGKKRGVAVTVEAPEGPIRVYGVHLSHRSETVRAASARYLIDLAQQSEHPVIVAGDVNSTPTGFPGSQRGEDNGNAMDVIIGSELWRHQPTDPPDRDEMTFHSSRPSRVIDWILLPNEWSFGSYEVIGSELSDHRLVAATIRIPTDS
jgi:endonuclease/exonuclease/phosphatase family metal-dependent hydrolase